LKKVLDYRDVVTVKVVAIMKFYNRECELKALLSHESLEKIKEHFNINVIENIASSRISSSSFLKSPKSKHLPE